MIIPQSHFLAIGAMLFTLGLWGVLTRRNAIGVLMSIELMLNAANINLLTFNRFSGNKDAIGHIFALFVIGIAAAAAVVGLTLVIKIYRNSRTIFMDKIRIMKW